MRKLRILSLVILINKYIECNAASLPTTFTATIAAAPTIAQITQLSFGVITGNSHASNNLTYILDTSNNVTTTGGGVGSYIGNSANSGGFSVTATAGQGLTIYINSYTNGTAPGGNVVNVGSATCKYGSGAQVSCDGSGNSLSVSAGSVTATSTLKVGVSITVPPATSTSGPITGLGYTVNILYT